MTGHKGPDASLPCPTCLESKLPAKAHLALDLAFGSMKDLCCTLPPRHFSHLVKMGAALTTEGRAAADLGLSVHLSIERSPLVIFDPRQRVTSPVHLTIGITRRILRLGVEILIADRSPLAGWLFADTLAEDLCHEAGVHPVPHHGGNFIGRHCGTIARRRDTVCPGLHGRVSSTHVSAFTRAWEVWSGLVPTVEAWHGHINQNAAQFSAGTEVQACVRALRAAALAGAATNAVLRVRSPIR